jgi:hypothetical protein
MCSKTARGRYEKQTCVARTSEGPLCADFVAKVGCKGLARWA